jgi:hypothetical protein
MTNISSWRRTNSTLPCTAKMYHTGPGVDISLDQGMTSHCEVKHRSATAIHYLSAEVFGRYFFMAF